MENKQTLFIGLVLGLVVGVLGARFLWSTPKSMPEVVGNDHSSMTMSHQSNSMNEAMAGMTAGLQGKTGDDFDQAFLGEMIVHHEGAVAMAKLVLEKSKRLELRKLADEIIVAQTREIEAMRDWQKQWFR